MKNESVMSDGETVTMSLDSFNELKGNYVALEAEFIRLSAQPLVYATVVKADNNFKLEVFEKDDNMLIIDKNLKKQKKFYGKIVSEGVDANGWVILEYPNGKKERLNIGLNGQVPQVKLLNKDDGMNVVITLDGKLYEVHGLPGVSFKPSDNVKVDMESKQIHMSAGVSSAGDIAYIKSIVDPNHIEVEAGGNSRVVIYGLDQKVEPSDRVMLDNSNTVILRVLEKDGKDLYNLSQDVNLDWSDIAGSEDSKSQLIEAIETPHQHPEVYKFYNMKPPKGILLFGPQGCGKTLLGKAAASSLARIHGKQNLQSGFLYVQGPELLSKWVGETESKIRGLFARGREHYQTHGYPAILFIDEADAILPMRGSGKSSDVENTIVPQFLSVMDGLEDSGVMVLLATNQPKRIDPAVVREGRIDRHVKVSRPTRDNAKDYFRIHMRNAPLAKGLEFEEVVDTTVRELYHEQRVLYRVTHQKTTEPFRLGHAVTGAMIAGVVAQAKSAAMKRDLGYKGKPRGIQIKDFQESVQNHYIQHAQLNATFDLEDFCDNLGFDRKSTTVEKVPLFGI